MSRKIIKRILPKNLKFNEETLIKEDQQFLRVIHTQTCQNKNAERQENLENRKGKPVSMDK